MKIVCNTGPLVALGAIQQIPLLGKLFDTILIPEPVFYELKQGKAFDTERQEALQLPFFQIIPLDKEVDPFLSGALDIGEASVIQVCREQSVMSALIDERKGRRIARDIYRIQVLGTVRVLAETQNRGLIDSALELAKQMKQNGFGFMRAF